MVTDWEGGVEVKFNYKNHLLAKLNSGEDISDTDIDLTKVKGGFLSSRIYFLHNTKFKKTVVTAFHVTDKDGKVHHYNIDLFRFKRRKTTEEWNLELVDKLTDKEVPNLQTFLCDQDEFVGKQPNKRHYKILGSDSGEALSNLELGLNFILSPQSGFNLSQIDQDKFGKILNLVTKIIEGKNVVLEKDLYDQLVTSRTKGKLEEYKKDLVEFERLIEDTNTTETEMQNFLQDRIWFFGLNYVQSHRNSKPRFNSTLGSQYDFLLEGFNQVYDIVELKGPNEELFEEDTSGERSTTFDDRIDFRFSHKFSRALHQVMCYMHEFEERFNHITESQPSIQQFMYPKGTIVVSKRSLFPENGKNSDKYLHLVNRQFANIDILTYNDLADRAKIIINFIEGTTT